MATYLSPAVFVNEIDLSTLPGGSSGVIPAFVGTAKRGQLNDPLVVTNAQQFVDNFGEPFPESFLGYAVVAYFEEGSIVYVNRVGVECEEGQPEELSSICIDTTGSRQSGWGRMSVFKNIDFGRIPTRDAGESGFSFHSASTSFIEFTDALINEVTFGPTAAVMTFTGTDYVGPIDDEFMVLITGVPTTAGSAIDGASYIVTRSSDGLEIDSGLLVESGTAGTSEDIVLTDGIVVQVVVNSGTLDINDSFRFSVEPDNTIFAFNVDRTDPSDIVEFTIFGDYATADDFATAVNSLPGFSGEDYSAIVEDEAVIFRTEINGDPIQLVGTEGFALEIGQSLYAFDIPRSNLIGIQPEPYDFNSSNSIAKFQVESQLGRTEFVSTIPVGFDIPAATIASSINASATVAGDTLVRAYAMTIPGGDIVLVVETTEPHRLDQVSLLANGSNITSVRFAETVGFLFPYTENFRGYFDSRVTLPVGGDITEEIPLSCEQFANGDTSKAAQCMADAAYYSNIVGWFVATSPGSWVDSYQIDLSRFEGESTEAGTFTLKLFDDQQVLIYRLDNFSFNPSSSSYIGDLVNPGTTGGGAFGNEYLNWENRPDFLGGDAESDDFQDREPAGFFNREFAGQANGIPSDPAFSSELDRVVIGNPALSTGLFAFSDPEKYDISLMSAPGFSSGAVIIAGISIATQRGDVIYLVDSPFGLNANQVVDWHNGLLFDDLQVALNSSYAALYYPYVKISDQFNGGTIYTPPSGHVAAVYARTERVNEQWFAPAGLNRGKLTQALSLEYDLTRGERDLLYGLNNAVNPIVNFPQQGIYVWGQRTLQRKDSALDRVNVRMLLSYIKKGLAGPNGLLNYYIFEQNDDITRATVTSSVENFMSDIQSRRGVTGYRVICDTTNNTPIRIDRNELHISLLVKPTRVAEFIVLNIAVLRTDQSFSSEEVLQAAGVG